MRLTRPAPMLTMLAVLLAMLMTTWPTAPSRAAFAGANGEILFFDEDGLIAVAPDGGRRVVLDANGPNVDVSPDGRLALFSDFDDDSVKVVSLAGGPTVTVVEDTGDFLRPAVAWSPDGSRFAWTNEDIIEVRDADGGNPRTLYDRTTSGDGINTIEDLEWSSQNQILGQAFGDLIRIDPETGARERFRNVSFGQGEDWNVIDGRGLDASPDGAQLVTSCFRDAPDERDVPQLCRFDTSMNLLGSIDTRAANIRPEFASFSPDGTRIAFMGNDDGDFSLYTIGVDGTGLQLLEPDGQIRATSWGPVPATPPTPLEEPPPPPSNAPLTMGGFDGDATTTERADFTDPILYAIAVARARFGGPGSDNPADYVVLSRVDAFADSLVGAALTGNGPLLFTPSDVLDDGTKEAINDRLDPAGTVYLLGGEAAISADVEAELAESWTIERLSGPSRVETSIEVARKVLELGGGGDTVAVARAGGPADNPTAGWADSVSSGAWTARDAVPTVVTGSDALHPAVAAFLDELAPTTTVLLGGPAALSEEVAQAVPGARRVSGASRAGTAEAIQTELVGVPDDGRALVVINGFREDGWLFGLPAGGLAADAGAAIALATDPLPPETARMGCSPEDVDLLLAGGFAVLDADVEAALEAAPAC